ncbi:hypothetical protein CA51_29870 [Rosistilla oblonga]|nr:hypothetical protein CA51_29870 [Rosistilla oblonga]
MMQPWTNDNPIPAAWAVFAITAWFARAPLHWIVNNATEAHRSVRLVAYCCIDAMMAVQASLCAHSLFLPALTLLLFVPG